jgi:hypothetical protein
MHYATSRKVAGYIPVEVIGFPNWPNPSSSTMALGSTQPLTEMSTRNLPEGKGLQAGAYDWQTHRHLWADYLENVGASTAYYKDSFTFVHISEDGVLVWCFTGVVIETKCKEGVEYVRKKEACTEVLNEV